MSTEYQAFSHFGQAQYSVLRTPYFITPMTRLLLPFSLLLLFSCQDKKPAPCCPPSPKNDLTYFTDFEGLKGFVPRQTITTIDAHSGNYAGQVNQFAEFGPTMDIHFEEVPAKEKAVKKVQVSAWFKFPKDTAQKAELIVNGYRRYSGENFLYEGIKLKEANEKTTDKGWKKHTQTFDLDTNFKDGNALKIYLWNPEKKGTAWMDDLEVEFLE